MRMLASCAVLLLGLVLAGASAAHAQAGGVGLVVAVDVDARTLTLETRSGMRRLPVSAEATIRGERDEPIAFRDLQPGDAVSYRTGSDTATRLHVVSQFWAIPAER